MSSARNANMEVTQNKGLGGLYVKSTHVLVAFMSVVLLVIGVALIVYYATDKHQPVGTTNSLLSDKCKKEAKEKLLCIVKCSSTPVTTRYPSFSHQPTISNNTPQPTHKTHKPTVIPHISETRTDRRSVTDTQTSQSTSSLTTTPKPPINRRLPTNLYPLHYKLVVFPKIYDDNENNFTFDGALTLKLRCDQSTNVITLHSNILTYIKDSLSLTQLNGGDIGINSYSFDLTREFIILKPNQRLDASHQYVLSLNFTRSIKRDSVGLYHRSYTRSNNSTAYIAATLMSTNQAHTVFPCFDEPYFKSVFQISILRKSQMHSLSNMDITETRSMKFVRQNYAVNHTYKKTGNGYELDIYEDSVNMSPHVFGFIVSDFVNYTVQVNGTRLSVWTRPEFAGRAAHTRELAFKIIPYLSAYFGKLFTPKKLDYIAMPDFKWGGMMNWGLVFMHEKYMFCTNNTKTEYMRFSATGVSHLMSHLWFSNLLTCKWWSDIWLHEGFNSYFMYLGLDHAEPSWTMFDHFRNMDTEATLLLDSYKTSGPIQRKVDDVDATDRYVNPIVFKKGAHVLKMMNFFMGEKQFREGLQLYIQRHQFRSVNTTMLWDAMKYATGIDVESVMNTWVKQNNFPVVHIRRLKSVTGDNVSTTVTIRQQRFLYSKDGPESEIYTSPYGYKWRIPMSFVSNSPNYTHQGIMWLNETKREQNYGLSFELKDTDWILGNPGDKIFCRTNYDDSNWQLLIRQLKTDHTKISVLDRTMLIGDACELSEAGYVDLSVCLGVISYIQADRDQPPLTAAVKYFSKFEKNLRGRPVYVEFVSWAKPKFIELYDNLDSGKVTNDMQRLDLSSVPYFACTLGYKRCLNDTYKTFKHLLNTPTSMCVDPSVISTIYCDGLKTGTIEDWKSLYSRLKGNPKRRASIIFALGCQSCDVSLLSTYLNAGITEMNIEDVIGVFSAVANSQIGRTVAIKTLFEKWDLILKKVGHKLFSTIIHDVTRSMNTQAELSQVRILMKTYPKIAPLAFNKAVKNIEQNMAWLKKNEQKITNWLNSL